MVELDLEGLAQDIMRRVLRFADDCVVLVGSSKSHQVRFSQNRIDVAKTWNETSIGIMMDKDKRVNVLELSLPSVRDIDEVLEAAEKALLSSQPRPIYAELPEVAAGLKRRVSVVDVRVRDEPGRLIDHVHTAIEAVKAAGARRAAGSIRGNYVSLVLASSRGEASLFDEYTNVYMDVRAFLDGEETGHASQLSRGIDGIDAEALGREAGETARLNSRPIVFEPGRYDTVITPNAAASIMNLAARASSAFFFLMGMSFFAGKLGQSVGSDKFNLIDNPFNPNSRLPRLFDDEGVETRRNVIVEDGVLKGLLHNRFTAKAFNSGLTGNSGWVVPHPWHLEVGAGDYSFDELIRELGKGLVLNNVTYIRFQNYVVGDFSGVIRDGLFYVEGGEIKGAVKGLRFSDNALRILRNIVALGRDVKDIYHWWLEFGTSVSTPSILVKDCGYTKAFGY